MIRTVFSTGPRPSSAAAWIERHRALGLTVAALVVADTRGRALWGDELTLALTDAAHRAGLEVWWLVWVEGGPRHAEATARRLVRLLARLEVEARPLVMLDAEEPFLYQTDAEGQLLRHQVDGVARPVPRSPVELRLAIEAWGEARRGICAQAGVTRWGVTGHPRLAPELVALGQAVEAELGCPQVYDFLKPDPADPTHPAPGHWSIALASDLHPERRLDAALEVWGQARQAGAWKELVILLAAHHQRLLPGAPLERMKRLRNAAHGACRQGRAVGMGWWDLKALDPDKEAVIAAWEDTMTTTPAPVPGAMLRRGSRGHAVRQAQQWLARLGYDCDADGVFGRLTEAVVTQWQEDHGLAVDGDLDARDLDALRERANALDEVAPLGELPDDLWGQLDAALELATSGGWTRALETGRPQSAGPAACVYGPGRGLWLERARALREMEAGRVAPVDLGQAPGVWVATCGPGGLGRSARQRSGQQRPSFHCSSWTNFLAGVATGINARWTHTGNMPALERLLTETGRFVHKAKGTAVEVQGLGEHFTALPPDGTTAAQHRLRGRMAARYLDPEELLRRRGELGAVTLLGQSTRQRSGAWRYEHHTAALLRHPAWPDRLFRVAADGSHSGGRYSGTPMDVEVFDRPEALRLEARVHFYVHTLTRLPDHLDHCPITQETP